MPVIGKAFSDALVNAITSAGEGQANRNLQAAIADRRNKLAEKEMTQKAQMFNASLAAESTSATKTDAFNREKIETLKEAGRQERADKALEFKREQEGRRSLLDAVKRENLGAKTKAVLGEEGRAVEQAPVVLKGKELKNEKIVTEIARNRNELDNLATKESDRHRLVQAQIKNYESLIKDRGVKVRMRQFADALKASSDRRQWSHIIQRWNQMVTSVNEFGQKFSDRQDEPEVRAAFDMFMTLKRQYQILMQGPHDEWEAGALEAAAAQQGAGAAAPQPSPGGAFNEAADQAGAVLPGG
jgi:hypothetical protein